MSPYQHGEVFVTADGTDPYLEAVGQLLVGLSSDGDVAPGYTTSRDLLAALDVLDRSAGVPGGSDRVDRADGADGADASDEVAAPSDAGPSVADPGAADPSA